MSKSNLSVGTKIRADKINAVWRMSALMVATEVGQLLLDAKAELPHGDFERMVKQELDFGPQTARKLMAVASDERIRNRAPGRVPDHWTTYYELTKLSDDQLDEALRDGVIHSEMRRTDVPKKRKESPQGDAVPPLDSGTPTARPVSIVETRTPQTEAKGEDSAVIYEDEPATNLYEADQEPRAGAAGAIGRFSNGLMWAMASSLVLTPYEAAQQWPGNMPLSPQELLDFTNWLLKFEDEHAKAVLQSAAL